MSFTYKEYLAATESKAVGYDLELDRVRVFCKRHDWFSPEGTPCPKCETKETRPLGPISIEDVQKKFPEMDVGDGL